MRTCIFDLETFSLYANTGVLFCCSYKEYGKGKVKSIRSDQFPQWRKDRTTVKPVVSAVLDAFESDVDSETGDIGFDLFVAHNGQYFDKTMLTSWAIKYDLPVFLRYAKFIDPVMLARRHMRLARNGLQQLLDFLEIPDEKTHVKFDHWLRAFANGDRKSLDYIVEHCERDVIALEGAYRKVRKLVKGIDEQGSAR